MPSNRRQFLQSSVGLAALSAAERRAFSQPQPKPAAQPTPEQRAWMELQFGMFIHFGINTYYDVEWSDGTLDPAKFNPTQLDTDQWCRVAKAAGMKYIVLTTKHHDGFCLWPSKHTAYSVKSTPYRGDLVGELVKSARKHGLAVGFYYSLWDRHEKSHDTDEWAYVEFMKKQLHELLTGYGEVVELWFDGFWKKQRVAGPKKAKSTAKPSGKTRGPNGMRRSSRPGGRKAPTAGRWTISTSTSSHCSPAAW